MICNLVISAIIYGARRHITLLFTQDPVVVRMTSKVLILVSVMLLTDGMQQYL